MQMRIGLLIIALSATVAQAREQAGAAAWLPAECAGVIQIYEPDAVFSRFQGWLEDQADQRTQLIQQLEANQELAQGRIVALGIAATAGVDIWEASRALLGREIAIGIAPTGGKGPAVGVIIRWDKPDLCDRLLQSVLAISQTGDDRTIKVSGEDVIRLNGDGHLCRVEDALILANSKRAMETILETRAGKHRAVSARENYQRGLEGIPRDAVASVFADLDRLRPLLPRNPQDPGKIREAFPGFLFGGWYHTLLNSPHSVAWLRMEADALVLDARLPAVEPHPATHRGYQQKQTRQFAWNARDLPHYLAELQIGRDWAELFRERETLLTVAGVSEANNFASTLSTLFGGLDFVNEVLPNLGGPTRLIMTDQVWPTGQPVPVPHLPAFALVAPLKPDAPKALSARLFSAAQMALSLINLDAAQNGNPTYLLDLDRVAGARLVFTDFANYNEAGMQMDAVADAAPEEAEDGPSEVSVRYNFRPAVTIVEGQVVISTSDALAREIIKQVKQGTRNEIGSVVPDTFQVDGPALVQILQTNHRELVINRMLEENQSKGDATRDINILLELLSAVRDMQIRVEPSGTGYAGQVRLSFGAAK